jgi:uncharacterized protein YgiM (DUF1202 family)
MYLKKKTHKALKEKILSVFRGSLTKVTKGEASYILKEEQGVCHTLALPFTLKSILIQKKNYENSNISRCKDIPNLQKNLLKETKILQDIIITLELISSFNTSQKNIIFQKSLELLYSIMKSKHNILALVGKANKMKYSSIKNRRSW